MSIAVSGSTRVANAWLSTSSGFWRRDKRAREALRRLVHRAVARRIRRLGSGEDRGADYVNDHV
jgi:hypothetical protein